MDCQTQTLYPVERFSLCLLATEVSALPPPSVTAATRFPSKLSDSYPPLALHNSIGVI